jgi:hypothetical protein
VSVTVMLGKTTVSSSGIKSKRGTTVILSSS